MTNTDFPTFQTLHILEFSSETTSLNFENLSVWQIPVFRYELLLGYIEFEMLGKQCCSSYLRNSKTAKNTIYKRFSHNLPIFVLGIIWLNIGFAKHWYFLF
jgi:hypothetical protein